jgi:hypothetical protein
MLSAVVAVDVDAPLDDEEAKGIWAGIAAEDVGNGEEERKDDDDDDGGESDGRPCAHAPVWATWH